ncbi:oxidoreductase [Leucobacter sp. Psy1]|uniref:ferredoxin reductase family protein n=1 Tax=Leucobacter sp. Psy1 TaxID=2875729 RepID=UPI001CD5EA5D|nr:ferredoxin reductase family protein [Leucobacter sp. Psy1]UBH05809.1 oxidoreductase [Leucobacter sp. Psy1]
MSAIHTLNSPSAPRSAHDDRKSRHYRRAPAPPEFAVPGHPRAWRAAATVVVWLSSLAITALWVAGGGVTDLLAFSAESLVSLSRITGLISANLLLLQVILMARIPVFERGFGRAAITRAHRTTGMWSFALLTVHLLLIVIAYALQDGVSFWAEAWSVVTGVPGVLAATIGVAAMILVMSSSAAPVRRRLRYESWHLLHLYAYFGVALAIPHMLLSGGDFVANPIASTYWWLLWTAAFASVVVFRVGMPLGRSLRHGIRVVEVTEDGPRAVTVRMRGRDLHRLRARAGQHFVWRFQDGAGWSAGHPFSLSAAPTRDHLQISARVVGDGSARLRELRPGTRVLIEGPFGHMTGALRSQPRLLMIGAGAGVAPLIALLEAEPFAPGDAILVTRDRAPSERMLDASIERLVQAGGLVHIALDGPRERAGSPWLPAAAGPDGVELLRRLVGPGAAPGPDPFTDVDVYLCGPAAWMSAVQDDLTRARVRPDRIHIETFATHRTGAAS